MLLSFFFLIGCNERQYFQCLLLIMGFFLVSLVSYPYFVFAVVVVCLLIHRSCLGSPRNVVVMWRQWIK